MTMQSAADFDPLPESSAGGKRARKCDSVYQDLKRKILTGELTSDSPITEQSLAQDYGCSQSTIREALLILQQYGLVIRRGYQGTFVTDPGSVEAMLLLKLRTDIEVTGIAKAATRITQDQICNLRSMAERYNQSRKRRDVFLGAELDRGFHLTLFRTSEMPVLEPMLLRSIMMLQLVLLKVPRSEQAWNSPPITRHSSILDALDRRDVDGSVEAMRDHILSSATLLAPHIYGTDTQKLRRTFEQEPERFSSLAGSR
ncbi:GntR family transcriptional regulator [Rhodobacterales bacterium]|nr:GntR family transcriptional regulator [Rhodobacterales bacterium]